MVLLPNFQIIEKIRKNVLSKTKILSCNFVNLKLFYLPSFFKFKDEWINNLEKWNVIIKFL